jgi:type III secretory pathway lipoprotein EscJ
LVIGQCVLEASPVRRVATELPGLALLTTLALGGIGCEAPARPIPEQRRTDKRTLFGDASLVPTREGERVRRELALAGELTTALELLELGPVHVDLELQADHPSAVVVAQLPAGADVEQLEADVFELTAAVVPALEASQIHVWLRPSAEPSAPTREGGRSRFRSWALTFACLGLGLSLGVTLERARARRAM